MALSKVACEIMKILNERGLDSDSCIGVMIELRHYSKDEVKSNIIMLEWLKANPEAGQEEVFNKLDDIID